MHHIILLSTYKNFLTSLNTKARIKHSPPKAILIQYGHRYPNAMPSCVAAITISNACALFPTVGLAAM